MHVSWAPIAPQTRPSETQGCMISASVFFCTSTPCCETHNSSSYWQPRNYETSTTPHESSFAPGWTKSEYLGVRITRNMGFFCQHPTTSVRTKFSANKHSREAPSTRNTRRTLVEQMVMNHTRHPEQMNESKGKIGNAVSQTPPTLRELVYQTLGKGV